MKQIAYFETLNGNLSFGKNTGKLSGFGKNS